MDCLYSVRDTSIQDYDWWLRILLEYRMYQGKDLCISDWCKLRLADSRSWECTLVGKRVVIRGIPARTCTQPVYLIHDICCSDRRDSDCMVLLRMELHEKVISLARFFEHIDRIFFILNTFHYIARNKRVSGGTGGTTAHRSVIYHVA